MLRGRKLPLLHAQAWGIRHQERKKLQIPGWYASEVTGQIEPCIIALLSFSSYLITKYFEGFPQI